MPDDPVEEVVPQLLAYVARTDDLVGVTDGRGRVLYMNEAARKRLGVGSATELTTADIFPTVAFAQYYDEIRPALLRAGAWSGEIPVLSGAGDAVPMLVSIVAQVTPGGGISSMVMLGRERPVAAVNTAVAPLQYDELTSLPQRSILEDRMSVAVARATRYGQVVGVILVDVDALKDVNDSYGHAVGDELLRAVARRLQRSVRTVDTVARIGGDEFAVLLDGVGHGDDALTLAKRIRDAICDTPFDTRAGKLVVTASFGVSLSEPGIPVNELLPRADAAMYRAKAMGGGQIMTYDDAVELRVTTLADEFALAVSHGRMKPHVQRVVNLRTGELAGYQGLARWDHPERGTVEADAFIDLVSNTAMAPVVDLAVLRRTAAVAARAARRGEPVRAYGHLSRRLIGDPALDRYLMEIAHDLSLAPNLISVEISHALVARRSHAVRSAMHALRDAGVRIVLSDVQGECEVDDIVELGFDELRLSRHLVHAAAEDPMRHRVVTATVAFAHALDLPVIAVGVGDERQEMAMLDAGCDFAEGFQFGAVVPSVEVE